MAVNHFCRIHTVLLAGLLFSTPVYASFIESTEGAAVINDATATYLNPASLSRLKNPQFIALGSVAYFHSNFNGQVTQTATGFTQSGTSSSHTHYYLPSIYLGIPATNQMTFGLAIVSNFFNRDAEDNAILRYVQANNSIQDVDFIPAVGVKFNDYLSLGAGLNFSYAHFLMQPISGFPTLNVPDSQSRNDSSGTGVGGDFGILLKPTNTTLIGFNYRSSITYQLSGSSIFEGTPRVTSNNYHYTFWTPARNVLSISQYVTPKLGFISTVQYIQWNIFQNINIHGIATPLGVVPNAAVPYHLHNSWAFTFGSRYHATPQWIIRAAGTYLQSPANAHYQIANGDSIILGASTGYEINKYIIIDGSYAHAFISNQTVNIGAGRNIINGVNKGSRDSVSLKLTLNIV